MSASPRSNEAREGRRRRLAERGSDRMALITGQISTLPPPPPPPTPTMPANRQRPPRHQRPESMPVELAQELHPDFRSTQSFSIPASDEIKADGSRLSSRLRHQSGFRLPNIMDVDMLSQELSSFEDYDNIDAEAKLQVPVDDDDDEIKPSSDTLSSQSAATDDEDEDKHDASTSTTRLKHQSGFKFSKRRNFQIKTEMKPLLEDSDSDTITSAETKEQFALKPSSAPLRTQNTASDGTKKLSKPINFNPTSFSSREINSCIIASETLRARCALVIAVFVVLCYMISEKIAAIRPLFIVLLTDITIVVARVYLEKIRAATEGEGGGERVEANHEHGHDWNGVKLLERGLVAYQALRGVFIDCSVYSVVVISFVSLMK